MQLLLLLATLAATHAAPSRIVFPDSRRDDKKLEPITPPVLPVIPHLENDPTALRKGEAVSARHAPEFEPDVKRRFGDGLDVSPNRGGGLTATFSNGFTDAGGNSQSASHSLSYGFNGGFQASHSSSSSSAFNAALGGNSGSQANSQAASFSVGSGGISAASSAASAAVANGQASANSQSASFGVNAPDFGGHSAAAGSQSASSFGSGSSFSNSAGSAVSGNLSPRPSGQRRPSNYRPNFHFANAGLSDDSGFSRPTFGEGFIDIRSRPVGGPAATSVVFPGELSRDLDDDSDELISFDERWLTRDRKGGLANWLSVLVSD